MTKAEEILRKIGAIISPEEKSVDVVLDEQPVVEDVKKPVTRTVTIELAEVTTEGGITLYAEVFEVGQPIFVMGEGEVTAPAPIGVYTLADGTTITVEVDGLVGAITQAATETTPPEAVTPEETVLSEESIAKQIEDAVKPLQTQLAEKDAKILALETKLSDEPVSDGVIENPEGDEKAKLGVALGTSQKTGLGRVHEMLFKTV